MVGNDLDQSEYSRTKPANEYRIALLGASITGPNAVYIRWADLLQDYLNRSPVWRKFVSGKFTRVLNFGAGGTGVEQWAPEYEKFVSKFSPDLVIGSLTIHDFKVRFIGKDAYDFASDAEFRAAIADEVDRFMVSRLPRFEFYPELLARTVGPYVGLHQHLTVSGAVDADEKFNFDDPGTALRVGMASINRVRCANPNFLIVVIPLENELQPGDDNKKWESDSFLIGLKEKFLSAAKTNELTVVDFAARYPALSDPLKVSPRVLSAFYNFDAHLSDYGVAMFASWAYHYLMTDWIDGAARHELTTFRDCTSGTTTAQHVGPQH